MTKHIYVNGKEITHPWFKVTLAAFVILLTAGIVTTVVTLLLTLLGAVVTAAFVLTGIVVVAVLIALPILLIGGSALGVLLAPFALLHHALVRRRR